MPDDGAEQITRQIGRSGISASGVGLGTWAIGGWMWGGTDEARSIRAIQAAVDHGISLIDTAPMYGSGLAEEILGKALKGRRDKVVLATKCGLIWHDRKGGHFFDKDGEPVHRYLGKESIIYEVEQSLRRLGTEVIDHYITHWQDPTTPIDETMAALDHLKSSGKIRSIGASNTSPEDVQAYLTTGQLDAVQEEYSMLKRHIETTHVPICKARNVSILSYSSLALGLLSGTMGPERVFEGDDQRKDNPLFSIPNRKKVAALMAEIAPIAEAHRASLAQIVIAWTLQQDGITFALCGARNEAQAIENAEAGRLRLDDRALELISAAMQTHLSGLER